MHKKKEQKKIYVASSRRVMLVLMSLSTIYQYMYSSLFSSALGMLDRKSTRLNSSHSTSSRMPSSA